MKRALFFTLALLVTGVGVASAAATTSADGRSATDGQRTLTVSIAQGLAADGQDLVVEGKGYDNTKGIYVAFCKIPPAGRSPGPCGGGQDREGASGESVWISNNPPIYARNLTERYGPGGTFKVTITIGAKINENVDCRTTPCAVTTRNDHTRSSDRSQDVFVPVHFVGGTTLTTVPAAPAPVGTGAPRPVKTAAPTTTTTIPSVAPIASVSPDNLSISGSGMTLRSDKVADLSAGQQVTLTGSGFDPAKGIYVALCAVPREIGAPGPCASGSIGQSAWISSNPPDYGKALAVPYSSGGAFAVTLTLDPKIDAETDCNQIACALTTRNDDANPNDRSQDLLLPVSFAAKSTEVEAAVTNRITTSPINDDESSAPWIIGVVVIALVAAATGVGVFRKESAES